MNKGYKPNKSLLRATFAAGDTNEPRFECVDREGKKLNGVQITLEGEALGHNIWLDRQFCQDVVDAGNARGEAGVKVRFGHPAMCSDALGTYLGRAKNFRLVDLTRKNGCAAAGVLADVYLDENADRTDWILNMAESAPDTFGQSIVFTYADTKYIDKDGVWHQMSEEGATMDNSADGKEYAILGVLHGTDFTDTPAATDGVFSQDSLAAEGEELLTAHPQIREVLEKSPKNVFEFLERVGLKSVIDAFENNRVAGCQKHEAEALAAKDAELEAAKTDWSTQMTKLAEERDALTAKVMELEEQVANLKEIEAKLNQGLTDKENELSKVTTDLGKAKADLDAEVTAHNATKKDLEETRASLAIETKRVQDQVAPALGRPEDTFEGDAREHLAKLPYAKRAAFYKAHKSEIDKKHKLRNQTMALTSPSLTLAVPALFGNVKPVLDAIKKLGPTDFSADAPEFTMKPGATIKVPVSSIAAASVFNTSSNNYLTGGTTDWASLTSAHYLQGFDISGVNIDEGCDKAKMEQLFVRRASAGIAYAIQGAIKTALNGVTTSTAITLPASATIADYMALNGAKDWYDFNMCALAVNGAEYSHMKAAFADKKIYADEEICKCIGCKAIVLVPGMTARMVIVPEGSMGFLGRVPTIIANYPEYGVEIDEDSGLAVGIVIADDQATNKRVANADEWFGCYILSSNAGSTTAGAIGVGTAV